jgi:hypothetical protein
MGRRQSLHFPNFRLSFGEECRQIDAIGLGDLFNRAEPDAENLAGFKALVIFESYSDQIGSLFLAQGGLSPKFP